MTDPRAEQARELREALMMDLRGRKGFDLYSVDSQTLDEWKQYWDERIAAALAAAEGRVTWTGKAPRKSGWYWWREAGEGQPQVLRIVDIPMLGLYASSMFDREAHKVSTYEGQWAGPLTPPAGAQGGKR